MNKTNVGVVTTSDNVTVSTQPIDNCLKSTSNFTETTYQNICNGQSYTVPRGSLDIIGFSILIALGMSLVFIILVMLFEAIFDY
jgi:hypothetical protein